jgi:hypothetical protein
MAARVDDFPASAVVAEAVPEVTVLPELCAK